MPTTKAGQAAVHRYVKNNYDRLDLTVPKGKKEIIKEVAAAAGESVNAYINRAIDERMEREAVGHTPEGYMPSGSAAN